MEPLLDVRAIQDSMLINPVTQYWIAVQKPGLEVGMDRPEWRGPQGRVAPSEKAAEWGSRARAEGRRCGAQWEKQRLKLERGWEGGGVGRAVHLGGRLDCQAEEVGSMASWIGRWHYHRDCWKLFSQLHAVNWGIRPARGVGTAPWETITIIHAWGDKICRITASECVISYICVEFQSSHSTIKHMI